MAAVPEVRPRCMIWLGRPSMLEREVLAAAGWDLRIITDPSGARIGVRGSDRVAVVLDLRDAGEDWIGSMQALLAPHSDLPVAALVRSKAARYRPVCCSCASPSTWPRSSAWRGS